MYLVLLGLPGAGKGTQAVRLTKRTGLPHVTTGELFRENIRKGTELGKKAQPYVENGLLVPDEITIGMLRARISQADCAKGWMLDGFPRNTEQARALDEALAEQGQRITKAIYIKVDTEELVRRLAGRWNCPQCGAIYHEATQPPRKPGVCDNCGSHLVQREDDKPEVVRTRLQVNVENLQPLLQHYRSLGKLTEVDGQRDPEAIARELTAALAA